MNGQSKKSNKKKRDFKQQFVIENTIRIRTQGVLRRRLKTGKTNVMLNITYTNFTEFF